MIVITGVSGFVGGNLARALLSGGDEVKGLIHRDRRAVERLDTRFSLQTLKSNRHISHARATQDLGYQPRPFEKTISDAVLWFKENGYLKQGATLDRS